MSTGITQAIILVGYRPIEECRIIIPIPSHPIHPSSCTVAYGTSILICPVLFVTFTMMENPNASTRTIPITNTVDTQQQTARGMCQFFEWLGGQFGGTLPIDLGVAGEVLTQDALDLDRTSCNL
jgi:hypothetical protein